MNGRHFIFQEEELLRDGTFLEDGSYLSKELSLPTFRRLVLSWNCDTPGDSSIKIDGRAALRKKGVKLEEGSWSPWVTWGLWGNSVKRGSLPTEKVGPGIELSVDTLEVKEDGLEGCGFQFRVSSSKSGERPKLRLISMNLLPLEKDHKGWGAEEMGPWIHHVLDVPAISQMRRDPYTAGVMCSATCCAMILNYYGIPVLPEEAAWGLKDYDYGEENSGFGNWSFNTAHLGSHGFQSFVKSLTLKELKEEIMAGRPTPVSVAYSNKPEDGLPYLPAAPTRTPGHLIVARGFVEKDGTEFIAVNDPAAKGNEGVKRLYPIEDFLEAWAHSSYTAYVTIPRKEGDIAKGAGYPIYETATLQEREDGTRILDLYQKNRKLDVKTEEIAVILYHCGDSMYCEYIEPELFHRGLRKDGIQWERKQGPLHFIRKNGKVLLAELE